MTKRDRQYNGKKNDKMTNNDLQNTTQKTKDWATQRLLKTRGELMFLWGVSNFCSTCGTRRVTLFTNSVISHEWGTDRIMIATNRNISMVMCDTDILKWPTGQTIIHNILHWKLKIEQQWLHKRPVVNSCYPAGLAAHAPILPTNVLLEKRKEEGGRYCDYDKQKISVII